MRRTLGEVRTATLVDVSLAPDLAEHPKVRAIEGLLPGAMDAIDDSSLDVVLCMSVVEHLWEPEQTLEHFHRVLRPGGVVLRSTCPRGSASAPWSTPPSGSASRRPRRWTTTRCYYDPKDLWPLMVKAGFMPARHQVLQAQVRPQHLRGRRPVTGDTFSMSMTFTESFLARDRRIVARPSTREQSSRSPPASPRSASGGAGCSSSASAARPAPPATRSTTSARSATSSPTPPSTTSPSSPPGPTTRAGTPPSASGSRARGSTPTTPSWSSRSAAATPRRRSPPTSSPPSTWPRSAARAIFGIVGRDGGHTAELADACAIVPPLSPTTSPPTPRGCAA